jgi:hypothetical protein
MAKTKPVASGVDLTGLSTAQLKALVVEARTRVIEQGEKDTKAAVKALKASGELDSFKKEFMALGKEGKKLSRKATFDLVLPIRFTINSKGPNLGQDDGRSNIFSYDGEVTEGDLFNHSFEAKLTKDHNLNKNQVATLNTVISYYAENACEEIFDVVPEELMAHYDAYAEKVTAFIRKSQAAGLTLKDLA